MQNNYTDGFFNVCPAHGFLPIKAPLAKLPERFNELQNAIDNLPQLVNEIDELNSVVRSLPEYDPTDEQDVFVIQALFRAYTFITSAYLLAPAHLNKQDGIYGKALNKLPANIARPLVCVADKLKVMPWLEYHYAYSLGNYVKKDQDGDLDWQNLSMACSFTREQDEIGFIMNHVYINEKSPDLVKSVYMYFAGEELDAVKLLYSTLLEINARRKTMWRASNHKNYNNFRAFILGIKGNVAVFGDGVQYLGTANPDEYRQYRGQTGAQDNVIPTCDIFTGITDFYPENDLTSYLLDLRNYRPQCVQQFLQDLQAEVAQKPMLQYFAQNTPVGLVYLLAAIEQVYLFRNGHWQFVQKYIMANTKYPVATGGTPIISWLPNQILACLKAMDALIVIIEGIKLPDLELQMYHDLKERYVREKHLLDQQLAELHKDDYDPAKLYNFNVTNKLEDSA